MSAKRNWAVARVAFNTATEKDLEIIEKEDKIQEAKEVKEERYKFVDIINFYISIILQ